MIDETDQADLSADAPRELVVFGNPLMERACCGNHLTASLHSTKRWRFLRRLFEALGGVDRQMHSP